MQLKIDSPPTIPWIQALRGIAAVLVVITHSSRALTSPLGQEYFWDLFVHGALGVDLFFIISGFIMVLTTQKCDGSKTYVADFVIKRFSRIWPLLFVVSMVYLLVHWLRNEGLSSRYLGEILSQLAFRPVNPSPTLFFQMPSMSPGRSASRPSSTPSSPSRCCRSNGAGGSWRRCSHPAS